MFSGITTDLKIILQIMFFMQTPLTTAGSMMKKLENHENIDFFITLKNVPTLVHDKDKFKNIKIPPTSST